MASHIVNIGAAAATSRISPRSAHNPPLSSEIMPKYVRDYRANSHQVMEFYSALKARILAAKLKASRPEFVALNSYLTEEELELARFVAQQSETQAELQRIYAGIAAELDLVNARNKVFAVLFTLAAAASAALAAIAAGVDDKRPAAAVAAASAILLVAFGKWIDSLLKKPERGVKKHRDIIRSMIVCGKFTIEDLTGIYLFAQEMKAEAESISKMADEEVDVGKKVAALSMSFQKLERKANRGGLDASSDREAVLGIILTNLE